VERERERERERRERERERERDEKNREKESGRKAKRKKSWVRGKGTDVKTKFPFTSAHRSQRGFCYVADSKSVPRDEEREEE
jgi:hypothetical protein